MKLLGWMHRKFKQNSAEPLKELSFGRSSVDDQQFYPKPNFYSRTYSKAQRDNHNRNSFASLEAARVEEGYLEEESSAAELPDLFHGFLAIGTLGAEPVIDNPSTPTFAISVDKITEKETEATENELKLINDELEKILGAECKDDGCNDSSGRNSYVSTGRSSQGSTITLSGKALEGRMSNGNSICPLQGYLFGSAFELPETTTVVKKEHRTSLGELFQKTKTAEENGLKSERGENRIEKEADKSAIHLMKKILKKRMLHTSSQNSIATSGGTTNSASAETKTHKILQMFHKKVHPENSTASKKAAKHAKNAIKSNTTHEGGFSNANQMLGEDLTNISQKVLSKERKRRFMSQSNPLQVTLSESDSNGNRECWIKTDANYLVLEL